MIPILVIIIGIIYFKRDIFPKKNRDIYCFSSICLLIFIYCLFPKNIEGLKIKDIKDIKDIKKYHDDETYDNIIKQITRLEKHDTEKTKQQNKKKGVNENHPFIHLKSEQIVKYLTTYGEGERVINASGKNIEGLSHLGSKGDHAGREDDHSDTDINHELGPVRNQGALGICWVTSIIEAIDGAYYSNTNNYFRSSIQQVLDCIVDLDEYNYITQQVDGDTIIGIYPGPSLSYRGIFEIIEQFYKRSNRKIYSEEEYPFILDDCLIPVDVSNTEFCKDCVNEYENYDHDLSCEQLTSGDYMDTDNQIMTCETHFCSDCIHNGFCDKTCASCNADICENNSNCNPYENPDSYMCTQDTNPKHNKCLQKCRNINPSENRFIDDILQLSLEDINDTNIYNNLIDNPLMVVIHVTDDFISLGIDDSGLNNSYITFQNPTQGETIPNPTLDPNLFPFPYGDRGQDTLDRRIRSGNHAVILIGSVYKQPGDMSIPAPARGKYFWKLRNSWGESWGDHGNFYIERDINDEKNNRWLAEYNTKYSLLRLYSQINYLTLTIN